MIAQLDKIYYNTSKLKTWTRLISYAFFEGRPITAPGQWINPLVFRNINYGAKKCHGQRIEQPIFILGTGRSGTTILGKLLSMHKDIGYLNEPKAIWHSLYPFEDLTGNFTTEKASYFIDPKEVGNKMIDKANAIYKYYLRTVGASRVVDKYPELIFRKKFVETLFPDARFILIIRNGWDTCSSIENWSKTKGEIVDGEVHDWWGRDNRKWKLILKDLVPNSELLKSKIDDIRKIQDQQNMGVVEWILTMEEGLSIMKTPKSNFHIMKYEDLVSKPVEHLSELFKRNNLQQDANVLKYAKEVLVPTKRKSQFVLKSFLKPAFHQIMQNMNYD